MNAYKVIVRTSPRTSVHLVEADDEAPNRTVFRFKCPGHTGSKPTDIQLDRLKPANFRTQLLLFNRAYAVTVAAESEHLTFIEEMMKEAYGANAAIECTPLGVNA
jgi:hypothetical protein